MGHCISTTTCRQTTTRFGQSALCGGCQSLSRRITLLTTPIHVLDDDSLLHVFYLCRPFYGDGDDIANWTHTGRWWYALAQVCYRWRNIILRSATHLGLSLVCTYGTPVAEMLRHSPPFPLVIGYFTKHRRLTTKDEEGIVLALTHRDRVRRVRLGKPRTIIQKLIVAMDEEYPILEHLYIALPSNDDNMIFRFPETLQAPHLRHLELQGFAFPIGSPLLTTAVGLVTLFLVMDDPSTYFHPNTLLQWISLMPSLETLIIRFKFSIPNHEVERQLTNAPTIAPITLPNLHRFHFQGVSTYLEALVHRITTPRLKDLNINFFNQLTFSVPHLLQFIIAAESFLLGDAVLTFSESSVGVGVYPYGVSFGATNEYALGVLVKSYHLDWQASSMAQISNSLSQIISTVEHLVLQHSVHSKSSEEHNKVDRAEWRKFLRPFNNLKTIQIQEGLVKDLSQCLELEDGDLPLELLPELHSLTYYGSRNTDNLFTSFIDARRNAGRPVTVVRE